MLQMRRAFMSRRHLRDVRIRRGNRSRPSCVIALEAGGTRPVAANLDFTFVTRGRKKMKKLLAVAALSLTLAGCQTARQDDVLGGSLLGGGAGALIGGAATGTAGGAIAGGLIGAAAGAVIADASHPGRCYIVTRRGYRRYVPCR
jgi:hypothetical protein